MKNKIILRYFILLPVTYVIFLTCSFKVMATEKPLIFPIPQQIQVTQDLFTIDESVTIVVPVNASEKDLSLARFLVGDLSAKYSIALKIEKQSVIPKGKKIILMGTIDNLLVKKFCSDNNIEINKKNPGTEGYILQVKSNIVIIGGLDDAGAFWGLQSLRQLITKGNGKSVQGVSVRDWPNMPFRAIRLYVPGPENIAFFNRFLKDFMALYKYNKLVMEVNCMRLDKHPEVNAGWIEFSKYMQYTRTNSTEGLYGEEKNSTHHDAGDGYILEKEDVRNILKYANQNFIEVIPEIPSLTHGYYLLTRHPELAEYPGDMWPDTYCPSNPDSYKLMFDVYDEYIEVMHPKMVHIGHDEWWGAPMGVCPLCKDKDYSELFANDINKIHRYFADKGIKIAMWGDYLLEAVRDTAVQDRVSSTGKKYQTPGALRPEVVKNTIPKDILIFNWFWEDQKREIELQKFGFKQVYGNMEYYMENWDERIKKVDVIGGGHSSWTATNEYNIGKDDASDFLGCANLLWSTHTLNQSELGDILWNLMPSVRASLSGKRIPSEDGDPVLPVDISSHFNIAKNVNLFNKNLSALNSGEIRNKSKLFNVAVPAKASGNCLIAVSSVTEDNNLFPREINGISINEDVSSLIFLHACAAPSRNKRAYFNIPNSFDSADLLGWYEIIYEDGYKEIVPIQYSVNILEWYSGEEISPDPSGTSHRNRQIVYAYGADPIDCSADMKNYPVTFFAFEWVNKRYGKVIKEVNLKGSLNYQATQSRFGQFVTEKPMASNAIILAGISKVIKREPFVPKK